MSAKNELLSGIVEAVDSILETEEQERRRRRRLRNANFRLAVAFLQLVLGLLLRLVHRKTLARIRGMLIATITRPRAG